jgi:hypothetical protein
VLNLPFAAEDVAACEVAPWYRVVPVFEGKFAGSRRETLGPDPLAT